MKKLLFAAVALSALSTIVTSCNTSSTNESVFQVILLKSIESKEVGKPILLREFGYSEASAQVPSTTNLFTDFVVLKEQKFTGLPSLNKMTYGYTTNALSIETVTGQNATRLDSLKFEDVNGTLLAAGLYVDGEVTPSKIKYNTAGYRSMVGDTTLVIENDTYISATIGAAEKPVVSYTYTLSFNEMGIQQYGIVGTPYNWSTNRFGKQSKYLLEGFTRIENGAEVKYAFSYTLDGNGLISEEKIKRNNEDFMTNKYVYVLGTIKRTNI